MRFESPDCRREPAVRGRGSALTRQAARDAAMNQTLQELCRLFWISLGASVTSAAFTYVLIWRRQIWLRLLDAEESFWKRVGLPKMSFDRGFGESRLFAISFVFFTVVFFLLAVACAVLYFHFRAKTV